MIQRYFSPQTHKVYNQIQSDLSVEQRRSLDRVLFITLCESLTKSLPKNHRPHALVFLKSQDAAFDTWLQEISPHSRIVIEESLLRTLLSLQVE